MAQSDSDDENDPFSMFKNDKILIVEEDDVQQVESTACQQSVILNAKPSICSIIDDLFLRKDIYGLEALTNEPQRQETSEECTEAHR